MGQMKGVWNFGQYRYGLVLNLLCLCVSVRKMGWVEGLWLHLQNGDLFTDYGQDGGYMLID